ncbi:MAG: DUF2254 domain-containing protein, partial [Deltaproteobacteria bacterium]|nr:DUF2254 domain-containing protein [Deltaproteobacteria bacterium]
MAHLRNRTLLVAALAFTGLLATALGVYALFWAVDFLGAPTTQSPLDLFREPGAAASFSGLAEVTVGVLGIAITVVAIIVELAAHRYTPRITYLFVRDPVNILVMSFLVVTALLVLWVEMSLYGQTYPQTLVLVATGAMTASLLLLLPYFAYVFDFLDPTRVVHRLQRRAQRALKRAVTRDADQARQDVIRGIDQLGDIALNSVEKDKAITIATVNALAALAEDNLDRKRSLPEAWFETATRLAPFLGGRRLARPAHLAGDEGAPPVPIRSGRSGQRAARREPPRLHPHPPTRREGRPGRRRPRPATPVALPEHLHAGDHQRAGRAGCVQPAQRGADPRGGDAPRQPGGSGPGDRRVHEVLWPTGLRGEPPLPPGDRRLRPGGAARNRGRTQVRMPRRSALHLPGDRPGARRGRRPGGLAPRGAQGP